MGTARHSGFVLLTVIWVLLCTPARAQVTDYAHLPHAAANARGAVATVHPLATAAGMALLDRGGSAVDAAVAAAFVLGVVDSHNSGIGGGNFALVRWADGSVEAIDGREMAPSAASRDMYLQNGKVQPDWSKHGSLAVGVPGSVALYEAIHAKGGKLPWPDTLQRAVELADKGFTLNQVSADRIKRTAKRLADYPEAAGVLLTPQGNPREKGSLLRQPALADSYRALAREGARWFYEGAFAEAVDAWMKANGGLVTAADFANYRLRWREPVRSTYRGHTVLGFPPPSSGGVHVAQILALLEGFDLAPLTPVQRYHLLAEAMKLAFADRAAFLGDPDFVKVPRGLLDREYLQSRAALLSPLRRMPAVDHGQPPRPWDVFGKHTTHLSAVDRAGNWIAITTTINTSFGSKVMVPGTGVLLNNQMDDFSLQPGVPNAFGLVGNEANAVAPRKRPLSSMSPTLVLKHGEPVMALGAAGGPTIITQVVQAIINQLDLGMTPAEALTAQRVHHQWRPDVLMIENAMPPLLREGLQALGHRLYPRGFAGATQLIARDKNGGFVAESEPRIVTRNLGTEQSP